ncbi:hypothetical protein PBCVKS1B_278L [Paramecium bursaria Chlorella virus KS1B]|nr:hypothetical protein PBCVKS1B_278L [Paramecium bursaria Chlorella virus KS1B]
MAFFSEIVNITKNAQIENAKISKELERDAETLAKFTEKKIKNEIRKQAEKGENFLDFDLVGSVDTTYKWSVEELMFERITPGFVTVQERLYDESKFLQTDGPFEGFEISDNGGSSVITISWETQNDAQNETGHVSTPVCQPQPTTCPPAPKKPVTQTPTPPSVPLYPIYHNVFPYTGPSVDQYTNIFGNFPQNDGDYAGNDALNGNVEYINQLLADLFPNLR